MGGGFMGGGGGGGSFSGESALFSDDTFGFSSPFAIGDNKGVNTGFQVGFDGQSALVAGVAVAAIAIVAVAVAK